MKERPKGWQIPLVVLAVIGMLLGADLTAYYSAWFIVPMLLVPLAALTVVVHGTRLDRQHKAAVALASKPVPAVREPRDWRTGLDPADPSNKALLSVCPVCGMSDPERFALEIGESEWNGWPAHESCVAWLDGGPRPVPSDSAVPSPAARCSCMVAQSGAHLIRTDCEQHMSPFAGKVPPGYRYSYVGGGTACYLVPTWATVSAAGTISAASVPHQVGVVPDPCLDCGADRNALGHEFEGGRLCDRCLAEHQRRMAWHPAVPPQQPYLEPGTTTAPAGCLCRWKKVAMGYLVIDGLSYHGHSLSPPQRCSLHDKPQDFMAGISMAELTANMDLLSEAIRKATGIPPNRAG